jgi:5'-nucleotidase
MNSARGIFCNRTLNLRSIKAIGYDMDYTLIHYKVDEWERRAYEHTREKLVDRGWPVGSLNFEPDRFVRGLVIDTLTGNILKANRFGYVKRAMHGTRPLDYDRQRDLYARTTVDLGEPRWRFLNTLFSLSESCIFAQLVDLRDDGMISDHLHYADLYDEVRQCLDETHIEGLLKSEIIADPEKFVELDPDLPLTLLDQRHAGKKLLLITNSEWPYTKAMMEYAFDRSAPSGRWQNLFDVIISAARKPAFFSDRSPFYRVVSDEGLLEPAPSGLEEGGAFVGGHAGDVESILGVSGDQILYVGDHLFSDVRVSKDVLRWRTALILRELEQEIDSVQAFESNQHKLTQLMARKEKLEAARSTARLDLQRTQQAYGPPIERTLVEIEKELGALRDQISLLDTEIGQLAAAAGEIGNEFWGPLMRAGNDKSHLARQVERYADIYLSRVSNFLNYTPFLYMRAPRGSLPHDQEDSARYDAAPDESPL